MTETARRGTNKAQRAALLAALVLVVVGLVVGLSPVSTDTAGEDGYGCGSALGAIFGGAEDDWHADAFTQAIEADQTGATLDLDATPDEACPDALGGRRTLTLAVLAAAVVVGLGGLVLLRGDAT